MNSTLDLRSREAISATIATFFVRKHIPKRCYASTTFTVFEFEVKKFFVPVFIPNVETVIDECVCDEEKKKLESLLEEHIRDAEMCQDFMFWIRMNFEQAISNRLSYKIHQYHA